MCYIIYILYIYVIYMLYYICVLLYIYVIWRATSCIAWALETLSCDLVNSLHTSLPLCSYFVVHLFLLLQRLLSILLYLSTFYSLRTILYIKVFCITSYSTTFCIHHLYSLILCTLYIPIYTTTTVYVMLMLLNKFIIFHSMTSFCIKLIYFYTLYCLLSSCLHYYNNRISSQKHLRYKSFPGITLYHLALIILHRLRPKLLHVFEYQITVTVKRLDSGHQLMIVPTRYHHWCVVVDSSLQNRHWSMSKLKFFKLLEFEFSQLRPRSVDEITIVVSTVHLRNTSGINIRHVLNMKMN